MIKELKEKFPDWVNQINKEDCNLILSDDLDSLFSVALLKFKFGCDVRGFVDWNSGFNGKKQSLCTNRCISKKNFAIGVDVAIEEGRAFDNHVVMVNSNDAVNEKSANINVINRINRSNYYDKFCGSTLIQIMSLYNVDLSGFNDEQKKVICAIDGMYIPYKVQKIDFSKTQRNYMKQLEYEELSDFMKFYCNKSGYEEFYRVMDTYNLGGKIWTNDKGELESNIDIEGLSELFGGFDLSLPQGNFKEFKRLDKNSIDFNRSNVRCKGGLGDGLFNFVVTNKNYAIYSYK